MILVPEKQAVVLTIPNSEQVAMLIPWHQRLNANTIAVRHGLEEAKVLRNLGIEVPSPVLTQYDWPGKYTPYAHQKETTAFMTMNNRCFVFNEMGTCKTLSALWAADYLMNIGLVRRVLVLSTLSCLEPTWQEELFLNLMHRTSIVVHGSRKVRYKTIAENVDFYIMNHEGLRIPGIVATLLKRGDIDIIIVDEAAMLRNPGTKTYECFQMLLKPQHRLWMLTGQPCPNGPEDAFGLARLVAPDRITRYATRWQAETMIRVNQFKWVPKPDAMAKVFEVLQPAIRFNRSDCIDLPPTVYLNRHADLSKDQGVAYKQMKEKLRLLHAAEPVTAVNAAVKLSKLLQICCGAVKTDLGTYAPLDVKPRLQTLCEALDEANAKAIIFIPYTGALRQVAKYLEQVKYSIGVVDGHVKGRRRAAIFAAFKRNKDPRILVANPEVAAHGQNFQVADTIVWFSPIHSLDIYTQANDRMARPGQENHMRIVHIGCTPLEWGVYKVISGKDIQQRTLLDLYQAEMKRLDVL